MHKANKAAYCPPETEVILIKVESALLNISGGQLDENDDDDDFFDDGN